MLNFGEKDGELKNIFNYFVTLDHVGIFISIFFANC